MLKAGKISPLSHRSRAIILQQAGLSVLGSPVGSMNGNYLEGQMFN
jgi:hypothetical protein